jgi:transposase
VRYRKSLIEERSREINRLEKILEGANIKLSSYVSDLTGSSSRKLLNQAIEDKVTPDNIGDLVHYSMQGKIPVLLKAMDGVLTPIQKKLVKAILDHIDDMTRRINDLDDIINNEMKHYEDAINKIEEMPGIGKRSAEVIIAEIGADMSRFPTAAHLA